MLPGAFLPGASEASLLKLSELALTGTLRAGANFARLGVHLMLSVNIPLAPLQSLPLEDLVKAHRPQGDKWPGIIVDVAEEQIVADFARAGDAAKRLEALGLKFCVEGFGRSQTVFAQIDELSFAEVKLASAIVADCATDKVNAPLCKAAIDFAHNGGRTAVAVGVEKAAGRVGAGEHGLRFRPGPPARPANAGRSLHLAAASADNRAEPNRGERRPIAGLHRRRLSASRRRGA